MLKKSPNIYRQPSPLTTPKPLYITTLISITHTAPPSHSSASTKPQKVKICLARVFADLFYLFSDLTFFPKQDLHRLEYHGTFVFGQNPCEPKFFSPTSETDSDLHHVKDPEPRNISFSWRLTIVAGRDVSLERKVSIHHTLNINLLLLLLSSFHKNQGLTTPRTKKKTEFEFVHSTCSLFQACPCC
jgi:hypothetical protein